MVFKETIEVARSIILCRKSRTTLATNERMSILFCGYRFESQKVVTFLICPSLSGSRQASRCSESRNEGSTVAGPSSLSSAMGTAT